ncbi:MAG: hypothetical protein HC819_14060 [Cyclobacteriaceae bacterium]|nr:hypothetical protein [Cyclobacteriaceae bacterium]
MMINANAIVKDMKSVSDDINNGDGLISQLINDKTMADNMREIMDSLSSATASISLVASEMGNFADKMNSGNGTMSRLVNDSIMARDLSETIANAKERTSELEETIELVNDSWILNLFNKKKDKHKASNKEFVDAGDYDD